MKKTNYYYSGKLAQFNKLSQRLNRGIKNGTFNRLSAQKRNMLICRLKRLYNQLLGFMPEFKLKHILAAAAALVLSIGAGTSHAQTFGPPQTNPFGLTSTYYLAFPTFVDIDGDGDFDAFVGGGYGGVLTYFENVGTDTVPAFAAPQTNPFGLISINGYIALPTFVDIDGDGDFDAFVGNDYSSYGGLQYFENVGTNTAPAFAAPQTNPFGFSGVGYVAVPAFVDMDGDGDFDLIVGGDTTTYGSFQYFENTGTNTSPAFTTPQTNPFGLISINSSVALPAFADIDGDGDFDLLVGNDYYNYGGFQYFENTGTNTAPAFAGPQTNPFGLTSVNYIALPAFADIDGDGDFDLFAGEYYGAIKYFENTTTPNCPSPVYLTATNATLTTADLNWSSTNAGAAYTIEYGPVGFTPGTGVTVTGTSVAGANTQSISGLTATTLYDFYIQEDCGAGNFSANVGPLLFGTSPTGIEENNMAATITIYPNPANETFNISIQGKNGSEDMTLEIMNSIGQTMLKEQIEVSAKEYFKEINTTDFVKGLYFIKLSSKNSIITRKLIIL